MGSSAIGPTPTQQEIMALQGTRLSEKNPWDTYASEMTEKISPELEAAIAAYAQNRYEESKDNQTKEVLAELQENNRDNAKQYQWVTPEEYADIEPRIGIVLSHSEFINKLRKAKIKCWYLQHPHIDKGILQVQRGDREPEVACWVQLGYMPELSIMNFDDKGAPLAERRRGWRTCLLQLILKGIITEDLANKTFGKPKHTKAFSRYNLLVKTWRNQRFEL